ncbi:putative ABC transporter ATP-binding protein YfmR [Siminovitchia terrae]|uniref:ABC transporter ATP-binding protein YfmR n=1 Tax=Siminovitchia terrae TaxID=1914933 RepID=A0ABQ4KYS4_SIMTE|nr:ABC-F family ATP-binding cassette domain-containing protein [Siminovitchia terrae]GIN92436.1 putative ABC transporter ATP-binding protein YfmR [Siminovitchia terrae]GIN97178.1 putative ABC transporter ATP-binding protein YfmR [Siminovitchia terrae]
MLTIENLHKSYGDKVLFAGINCIIRDRERIGLIGVNGTGKSSFLKIVAGIESPDQGEINHAKDYRIEYLAQDPELDSNLTVIEQIYYGEAEIMKAMRQYEQALQKLELEPESERAQEHLFSMQQKMDELEAWDASAQAKTVLSKLGIRHFDQKVSSLSGGQKKRVAIAKALIQPADLLILDEPTNHLDNITIEWLEKYLASYPGALLLVTHDRYFLNRVTNRIYELDNGELYSYEGNYEFFLEKKAEREAEERTSQQKHANTLRGELAWLRRGAQARSTKQKARIERIEQMQDRKFNTKKEEAAFQVGTSRLGKKVIELKGIDKSLDGRTLIHSFDYLLQPGDKIGIIGPNGVGKTTLLNIMAKRIGPDAGEIETGETVKIGYYTQGDEELDGDQRVIDYIKDTASVIHTKNGEVITAEQMLERFLFSRPSQWTYIRKLSGGEKRRLYLLKVLMTEPNVLFLDEPTNDLDTQTLGVLEDYLENFPGVIIAVSHDRYFLDRVVDRLLVFKGAGTIDEFYGNYSEFLDSASEEPKLEVSKTQTVDKQKPASKKPAKLSYKDQKEWEVIEDEIAGLEEQIEEIGEKIVEAGSDSEKVQELFTRQQEVETALEQKMERWEELSLMIEELAKSDV